MSLVNKTWKNSGLKPSISLPARTSLSVSLNQMGGRRSEVEHALTKVRRHKPNPPFFENTIIFHDYLYLLLNTQQLSQFHLIKALQREEGPD